MKDIVKACLALALVVALAIGVFYEGDSNVKTKSEAPKTTTAQASKPASNYVPQARIDVSTPNGSEQLLKVVFNGEEREKEDWAKNDETYTLQSSDKPLKATVTSNGDIPLIIVVRGPWFKGKDGNLEEYWVSYSSVKVNGQEILTEPKTVWHNTPYSQTIDAKKGQTYQIEAVWEPK